MERGGREGRKVRDAWQKNCKKEEEVRGRETAEREGGRRKGSDTQKGELRRGSERGGLGTWITNEGKEGEHGID